MYPPDMKLVKLWSKKYRIKGEILPSEKPNKKLKIKKGDKWIHFGHPAYQDFSTHRDRTRQKSYCKRAGGIRDKNGRLTGNDPNSANFYAMRLLWDCKP